MLGDVDGNGGSAMEESSSCVGCGAEVGRASTKLVGDGGYPVAIGWSGVGCIVVPDAAPSFSDDAGRSAVAVGSAVVLGVLVSTAVLGPCVWAGSAVGLCNVVAVVVVS